MTEALLGLVSAWGPWALAVITFLSCLAVPVPSSLAMLAAGAFVASGDLAAGPVLGAALAGALAGDQAGFALGRRGIDGARGWVERSATRAALFARAREGVQRRGVLTVFLTRWLFSVLGPYVNLLAGATGMNWVAFTLASATGEALWVGLYVMAGRLAGGQIEALAALAGNLSGLAAALAVATVLALALWRRRQA